MALYHFDIVFCINPSPISGLNSRCLITLIDNKELLHPDKSDYKV